MTDQLVLDVGYDIENLTDPEHRKKYRGEVKADRYGRLVPKHAHGTANLKKKTSSTSQIMEAVLELYDRIVDENLDTPGLCYSESRCGRANDIGRDGIYTDGFIY